MSTSTHAHLAGYITRTHQPTSYVAECAKLDPAKLARFLANEGPLTRKELGRLQAFLDSTQPRWRRWVVRLGLPIAAVAGTACTTTVQEAVKTLIHHLTH